ncbi:hypothetical protein F5B19DRAFT_436958 [Rostrohypoxylon terebratum]|nr:hypothetical protein F5B19DRAFT_436958 [Rostrohypoxylon terebratum]
MSSIQSRKVTIEAGARSALERMYSVKSVRQTPGKDSSSKASSTKSQDKSKKADGAEEEPKRDLATGRVLVDDGGSCLRCTEKGLNCTLNFLGVERVDKCAACKRSGVQYCIRQRPVEKLIPWRGPPWKNPNYFSVGDEPSSEEMEEILHEHYKGQETYCNGEYMCERDRKQLALPPFNGSDLPLDQRSPDWKKMSWQDVLPTWENASLYKDANGDKALLKALIERPAPINLETIDYFRSMRMYPPRPYHLKEYNNDNLGETW